LTLSPPIKCNAFASHSPTGFLSSLSLVHGSDMAVSFRILDLVRRQEGGEESWQDEGLGVNDVFTMETRQLAINYTGERAA